MEAPSGLGLRFGAKNQLNGTGVDPQVCLPGSGRARGAPGASGHAAGGAGGALGAADAVVGAAALRGWCRAGNRLQFGDGTWITPPATGEHQGETRLRATVVALTRAPGTLQPSCTNPHGPLASWPLSPWGGDEHGAPGAEGRADGRGASRQAVGTLRSCRHLEQGYSPIAVLGLYR